MNETLMESQRQGTSIRFTWADPIRMDIKCVERYAECTVAGKFEIHSRIRTLLKFESKYRRIWFQIDRMNFEKLNSSRM